MTQLWLTRLKLLLLLATTSTLILIRNPNISLTISVLITVIVISTIKRQNIANRIKPLLAICCLAIVSQLLGNHLASLTDRLLLGIAHATKLLALSLLVFQFTQTTSANSLVRVFSFLPPKIVLLLTISFSLVPVMIREIDAIQIAQKSKGLQFQGLQAWRSFIPVIVPLLNRTLTRAQQIAIVLEIRGFENKK